MITKSQKRVLDYVKSFQKKNKISPSHSEIGKRLDLAVSTVSHHLHKLARAGVIKKEYYQQRSLEVLKKEDMISIPLLGNVAAGLPIEAIQNKEYIIMPKSKLPRSGECFALRVNGNSMIDENINDGDTIIVKKQDSAHNGEKVVALLDNNDVTLKTFYKENGHIRLQPAWHAPLLSDIFFYINQPLAARA